MNSEIFNKEYKRLNPRQREAVDSTEGPVMVIAGPGTGKTQILALRIANILTKTDTKPDGILCLTFTNSGVRAMRERLQKIIGPAASRVAISTFHSFGSSLVEEFYEDLSFDAPPKLLNDDEVLLYHELLENNSWEYLRPRSGGAQSFGDLRSLISLLKGERISPMDFLVEIESEIKRLENDPASISSRGPSKGKLRADVRDKIERFARTKEAGRFYELYEKTKRERNLCDFNDVLENLVALAKKSENARDTIRERFLYVLVDEHQDSSGVQNEFLEAVWDGTEKPNLFVVGDDRQLIYGFSGASLSHFEKFRETFPGTKLIALTDNYRSTQPILDAAGKLLQSSLVKDGLVSHRSEKHSLRLVEAEYPRDEILKAGIEIKAMIEKGIPANECAILVPKKAQARTAAAVLKDLGLPVASGAKASFFSLREAHSLISLLRVLADPYEPSLLAALLLDPAFGVPFLDAHRYLRETRGKLSLESFSKGEKKIADLGKMLAGLAEKAGKDSAYSLVQRAGAELFFEKTASHRELLLQVEVVRTMLHIALSESEKNPKLRLADLVAFLDRLELYGEDIPLAVFSADEGVKIMTLHGSKGLEFDFVWIAHLDEGSLMSGKKAMIALPESLSEKTAKKDELTAKRELYVAMTRARLYCTLSYARSGYSGTDQRLANIIAEMPEVVFERKSAAETEKEIHAHDPKAYVASGPLDIPEDSRKEISALVAAHYSERPVAVTHLNNFFSCPWKWYFRNFISLPEPENESLYFGNLVHGSIEKMLKEGFVSESKIPALIEEGLDSAHVFEKRPRERFAKDALRIISRFIRNYRQDFEGAISEKKMSPYRDPDIPGIEITGKIDAIKTLSDGTLAVTDFKTGRVKKGREIEKRTEEGRLSDMLRQLATYSYLLSHEKEKFRVSQSRLFFLEAEEGDADMIYQTSVGEEEIGLLRKDIKDFDSLLKNGEWTKLPCDFKPFGKQKECEYCALAKRLK